MLSLGHAPEDRFGGLFVGRLLPVASRAARPEDLGVEDLNRLLMGAAVAKANRLGSFVEVRHGPRNVGQIVAEIVIAAAKGDHEEPGGSPDLVQRGLKLGDFLPAPGAIELLAQSDFDIRRRAEQPALIAEVIDLALPEVRRPPFVILGVERGNEDQRQVSGGTVSARGGHAIQGAANLAVPGGQRASLALRPGHLLARPAFAAFGAAQQPAIPAFDVTARIDVVDVHDTGLDRGRKPLHLVELRSAKPLVRQAGAVAPA